MRFGLASRLAQALLLALAGPAAYAWPAPFTAGPDHPAIGYWTRPLEDPVARLEGRALRFDERFGYLPAVLEALDIPVESQLLVFSKTSLQSQWISAVTPRAIYFNETAAVAWIRGAPLLEIASQDPRQGVILRTLSQRPATAVRLDRSTRCLACHETSLNVPGMLVRSVHAMPDGRAVFPLGVNETDHTTPFAERWGGWFVSGPAPFTHLGNSAITRIDDASARRELPPPSDGFLYPRAEPAALLVFEHQMHGMNLLTRLGWESRVAEHMGADPVVAAARTIAEAAAYLRFDKEAALPAPVDGGEFARVFGKRGESRRLDLRKRLFAANVSYLAETPAFAALPQGVRNDLDARIRGRR